jgi:hypothetical protein
MKDSDIFFSLLLTCIVSGMSVAMRLRSLDSFFVMSQIWKDQRREKGDQEERATIANKSPNNT